MAPRTGGLAGSPAGAARARGRRRCGGSLARPGLARRRPRGHARSEHHVQRPPLVPAATARAGPAIRIVRCGSGGAGAPSLPAPRPPGRQRLGVDGPRAPATDRGAADRRDRAGRRGLHGRARAGRARTAALPAQTPGRAAVGVGCLPPVAGGAREPPPVRLALRRRPRGSVRIAPVPPRRSGGLSEPQGRRGADVRGAGQRLVPHRLLAAQGSAQRPDRRGTEPARSLEGRRPQLRPGRGRGRRRAGRRPAAWPDP